MPTPTNYCFNLQQLRATTQAGGISGVTLKAQGDAFYVVIQTRSGEQAILVTTQDKTPRRFKNPLRALAILRDIGIVQGHFDLSLYTPEQLDTSTHNNNKKASAQPQGNILTLRQPAQAQPPSAKAVPSSTTPLAAQPTQTTPTTKPAQTTGPAANARPPKSSAADTSKAASNKSASSNLGQPQQLDKQMQLL